MHNIKIRQITSSESDLKGIANIHRDCEDPWNEIDECTAWITKRLERGFYIQAAEVAGKIVGHGEWIISDEPDRKFLYLGMLQIDKDYQRKGIGRLMIADGIEYAKKNDCKLIVTIPDMDENADIFYRKCGFKDERKTHSLKMLTEPYKDYKFEKIKVDKVPFSAIKEKRYIFGKGQLSARHMWEVYNEKPDTDDRLSPAILLSDGTYIQLGYWNGGEEGYLMIWSNSENYSDIIKSALSFGYSLGLKELEFNYLEDEEKFIDGFEAYEKERESDFEQIYYIGTLYENIRHIKINPEKDKDYILECHCRVNYECDTPWARKMPYEKYRKNWFSWVDQQEGFLHTLSESMKDERTIAEIIKTESGELVGYFWVHFHGEDKNFIWADVNDIYIEESYRKSGIASYLMDYAEKSAKQNGAKVIRSGTGCENIESQGLHQKLGYYQYRYEYEKLLFDDKKI